MSLVVAVALALFVLPLPLGIAAIVVALVLELAEVAVWWRMRGRRPQTGGEALVGQVGEASTALDPVGRVRIRGETWRARSDVQIGRGEPIRVVSLDGLTLEVEPEPEPEPEL